MQGQSNGHQLSINSSSHQYQVLIGSGLLEKFFEQVENPFVIADSRFADQLSDAGLKRIVLIDAVEENKTLSSVEMSLIQLKKLGMTRDDSLVAIGGGIIQDIATLSASLYMRGVQWAYLPTTLLGMADSCIGGKSSINAGDVKNLVGNIYPPNQIVIDVDFISTLREVDIYAGLAEAAKIAFCKAPEHFIEYRKLEKDRSPSGFVELLSFILSQKKWFIEIDEFDRKERKLLNFGHTFGHALESATDHRVPHGIAVALGIASAILFVGNEREISDTENDLFEYMMNIASSAVDLNEVLEAINWKVYTSAFEGDKKHGVSSYNLIVPGELGHLEIRSLEKSTATVERVIESQRWVLAGGSV